MKLDIHNPPIQIESDVTLFSDDVSYTKIAEVAKALESLSVSYFPSNRMGEKNLPQVIEQFEAERVEEWSKKDKSNK